MKVLATIVIAGFILSGNAYAASATAVGKVVNIQTQARAGIPGVNNPYAGFSFEITPRPALAPGVSYARFSVSVHTIAEPEIRKSIISSILFAYASDKTVQVNYDDAGALIDNRMFGIYYVTVVD